MIEDHTHADDGSVIAVTQSAEHVAEAEVAATAAVEVARIEGDTAVQLAKIAAREVPRDLAAELETALAEIELLKAVKVPEEAPAPDMAPAAPVTVVDTGPAEEAPPTLPEREAPTPRAEKSRDGWFGERA